MLFSQSQSELDYSFSRDLSRLTQEFDVVRSKVANFSAMMAAYASGNAVPPELLSAANDLRSDLLALANLNGDIITGLGDLETSLPTVENMLDQLVRRNHLYEYRSGAHELYSQLLSNNDDNPYILAVTKFAPASRTNIVWNWVNSLRPDGEGLSPSDLITPSPVPAEIPDSTAASGFTVFTLCKSGVVGSLNQNLYVYACVSGRIDPLTIWFAYSPGSFNWWMPNQSWATWFIFREYFRLTSHILRFSSESKIYVDNQPLWDGFIDEGQSQIVQLDQAVVTNLQPLKTVNNYLQSITFSDL